MDSNGAGMVDQLAKFTEVDFAKYVAPKIVFFQGTNSNGQPCDPEALPFEPKNLVYDSALSTPNMQGTRTLSAKYKAGDTMVDLYIQTPEMVALFDVSAYKSDNGKSVNYSMLLSFNEIGSSPELDQYYKAMYKWDKEIAQVVFQNRQKYVPGVIMKSPDAVEMLLTGVTSLRKRAKDGQLFPPAQMLRIAKRGAQLDVTCIDSNKQPYDIRSITQGTRVRVIYRHKLIFKAKAIEVRNEPVLVQVFETARPTSFAF